MKVVIIKQKTSHSLLNYIGLRKILLVQLSKLQHLLLPYIIKEGLNMVIELAYRTGKILRNL